MSTLHNVRVGMGWRSPSARRFCANCAHGTPEKIEPRRAGAWRCEIGGFFTPRTAVCGRWKAK